jgi:hypothetical protein
MVNPRKAEFEDVTIKTKLVSSEANRAAVVIEGDRRGEGKGGYHRVIPKEG